MSRKKLYIVAPSERLPPRQLDAFRLQPAGALTVWCVLSKPEPICRLSAAITIIFSGFCKIARKLLKAVTMQVAGIAFAHPDLNEPVTACGGNYVLTGEQTIGQADLR